jgi:adenylosuccinate lyase
MATRRKVLVNMATNIEVTYHQREIRNWELDRLLLTTEAVVAAIIHNNAKFNEFGILTLV